MGILKKTATAAMFGLGTVAAAGQAAATTMTPQELTEWQISGTVSGGDSELVGAGQRFQIGDLANLRVVFNPLQDDFPGSEIASDQEAFMLEGVVDGFEFSGDGSESSLLIYDDFIGQDRVQLNTADIQSSEAIDNLMLVAGVLRYIDPDQTAHNTDDPNTVVSDIDIADFEDRTTRLSFVDQDSNPYFLDIDLGPLPDDFQVGVFNNSVSQVPLPAPFVLLLSALFGLGFLGRKRAKGNNNDVSGGGTAAVVLAGASVAAP